LDRILSFLCFARKRGVKLDSPAGENYVLCACLFIQQKYYDVPEFEHLYRIAGRLALFVYSSDFWNEMMRYLESEVVLIPSHAADLQ